MEADITSQAVGLASNTDFSILSLFLRADFIVKSVIVILILASLYSWNVIISKILRIRQLKKFSLSFNQFHKLAIYSKKKDLIFFSTPLDYESAKFLKGAGVKL